MKFVNYIKLLPEVCNYKLAKYNLLSPCKPLTLTYSVTNRCNSRCRTCFIWKHEDVEKELDLDEIERIFKSIGKMFFFNISGGEPFLREDLPEIVSLACKYLKPKVIHTPTNAISSDLVIDKTKKILEIMKVGGYSDIPFTIKPSLDGIGEEHDKIRGVNGNFENLLKTIDGLKKLQKEYKNLHIGVGTVISKFNVEKVPEIINYVRKLNLDSYIHEIAENRSELFNTNRDIMPALADYKKAIKYFINGIKKDAKNKKRLARIMYAFRIVYYRLVVKILQKHKQVIPCYAGLSNVHITPTGEVWPCCILGYEKPLGNLRHEEYNFNKIWYSKKAKEVRRSIRKKECFCPLANQAYSNLLCNPINSIKVAKEFIAMLLQ